ncbi:MAG: Major facilitator family sugar transporter [Marmoricola sp.]|nr:Major facilitator family sugar transporter [Marmoricola sp.]
MAQTDPHLTPGSSAGLGHSPRAAGQVPGRTQGLLLMFISCLPILGAVLLAPVLPTMQEVFADTPGSAALVPITLTVPALMIGLIAPFAGRLVDRSGRTRLLVVALAAYAVLGTAPLWLHALGVDGLVPIVVSRAGVGITEAAIMTCATTLIADYFSGTERDRWLGLQTVFASLSATVFFGLGGGLGSIGWRAPFWLYASSLVLAVLAARLLWQPAGSGSGAARTTALPPVPWSRLGAPVLVTLLGGVVFYTPIVELPYALEDIGVKAVSTVGAVAAVASLATAAGAFTFGRVTRLGTATLLPVAFALAGIGLLVVGTAGSVAPLVVGAVVCSAGTGLLLPTLLVWALSSLTFEQRGRGTGLWTAALFIGEFLCPLVVLALTALLGDLGPALVAVGVVALVAGAAAYVGLRRTVPAHA